MWRWTGGRHRPVPIPDTGGCDGRTLQSPASGSARAFTSSARSWTPRHPMAASVTSIDQAHPRFRPKRLDRLAIECAAGSTLERD
jgi:hypothetical protein